tara:strand:+ start:356 stop:493 length:138 start_codon:yes stop_codon:yes gene_type:complete
MTGLDEKNIKLQEWVVRFDGQINHSEMMIEKDCYHPELINEDENQ